MAYNVYKTDGTLLTTVGDGTIDSTTSLSLVGIGYSAYSEVIAENLVHLMENFSSGSPPLSPIAGQIWWDKTNTRLNVFDGNIFRPLSGVSISAYAPTTPLAGDFWYDDTNKQLFFYRDSWILVSPAYSLGQKKSGQIVETVSDYFNGATHTVTSEYNAENLIAVLSSSSFSTGYLSGIVDINPGINLANGYELYGIASEARTARGLAPSADANYMHSNGNAATSGALKIRNNYGLNIANAVVMHNNYGGSGAFQIVNYDDRIQITSPNAVNPTLTVNTTTGRVGVNNGDPQYYELTVNGSIGVDGDIWALTPNNNNGLYFDTGVQTGIIHNDNTLYIIHGDSSIQLDQQDGVSITDLHVFNNATTNGITNTGQITNQLLPTEPQHLANKQYVDEVFAQSHLPIGSVIMWYGAAIDVPNGWQICDGTNGTPDMRDKFAYGAGNVPYGRTGGNNNMSTYTAAAGGHSHTGVTSNSGTHYHSFTVTNVPYHTHDFYDVYAIQDDINGSDGNYNIINGVPTYYPYNANATIGTRTNPFTSRPNGSPSTILADADGVYVQPSFYFPGGDWGNGRQYWFNNQEGGTNPSLSAGQDHGTFAFKNRTLATGSNAATANTGTSGDHAHSITTDAVSDHIHIMNFDNTPSWVALYYIMRVA
jgi:hypothetical protein